MKLHNKRLLSKGLCLLVLIPALMAGLTGCIPYKELKELWIVQGVAIDGDSKNGYNLTYQTLKSSESGDGGGGGGSESGGSSGNGAQIFTSSGATIFDAFRSTTLQTGKKLYFSNNLMCVLSEASCKENLINILDVFSRDPEFKPDASIYVAKEDAGKVLTQQINGMTLSSKDIVAITHNYDQSSKTVDVSLGDLFMDIDTHVTDLIIPVISLSKNSSDKNIIVMDGAAVFNRDVLAGYLTPDETRGYLWVTGQKVSGVVVISPEDGVKVSCEVVSNSSAIKPTVGSDGKPKISVDINIGVNIVEVIGDRPAGYILKVKETATKYVNEVVAAEARSAVDKALKEYNSDVFGFGMKIYRQYPRQWKKLSKDWDTQAKDTAVTIKVKSKVLNTGQITK